MLRYRFWLRLPGSRSGDIDAAWFGERDCSSASDPGAASIDCVRPSPPFMVEYRLWRFNRNVPKAFVSDGIMSGSVDVDAVKWASACIASYLLLYVDADTLVLCLR